jgi:hypothetical protein
VDAVFEAARLRFNEVTRAALGGGNERGVPADAPLALAVATGLPRVDIERYILSRLNEYLTGAVEQYDGLPTEPHDLGELIAGVVAQSFLAGWLVRDEQEKRG